VKKLQKISVLFALSVLPALVLPFSSPVLCGEDVAGQLLDIRARSDTKRVDDVIKPSGYHAADNEPNSAAKELRYLHCLCGRCGPTGGEFTRDPKDDCDGACTCVAPCSPFCTPVPVSERFVKECYGSVYEVKDPPPVQVQNGLDIARKENRQTLEAALSRQLSGNRLDNAAWTAESALKHDPDLRSPMFAAVGRQAKAAGLEALDKGNYQLAIKRLEQAVRLLPADEEAHAKLAEAKEYDAKASAAK